LRLPHAALSEYAPGEELRAQLPPLRSTQRFAVFPEGGGDGAGGGGSGDVEHAFVLVVTVALVERLPAASKASTPSV
jgi:hypothetical protein